LSTSNIDPPANPDSSRPPRDGAHLYEDYAHLCDRVERHRGHAHSPLRLATVLTVLNEQRTSRGAWESSRAAAILTLRAPLIAERARLASAVGMGEAQKNSTPCAAPLCIWAVLAGAA
jgi:hypothetical protein